MKKKIFQWDYLTENIVDIGVSLIIYKLFGFEIAIIVILGLIMADIGMIVTRILKD